MTDEPGTPEEWEPYLIEGRRRNRGPYGTNRGDTWLGTDSPIQRKLDEDGTGLTLIHEVIERDGVLEEAVYVTDNAELIEKARLGTEEYVAQKASEN